ncbi:hypothetical protein VFPPC_13263 [Pochonia chlamydosporia 170]|uniref:Uncharacterized protein n=1 Tax=Pochonia chlamydosporia 170 TaxID=1380566 RepID=A0A179FW45_METCM|nr:hypothetical protein VFPPC_13263 [Pochonia chlamydosporia 170]OAQ69834.1 hypothetical protein VFPPC_13263 [Pochonia chlamydosporia 170]
MSSYHINTDDEVDVPAEAIRIIDPQELQDVVYWTELPVGTQVQNITAHGVNLWTRTAKIEAKTDGIPAKYFLKVPSNQIASATLT